MMLVASQNGDVLRLNTLADLGADVNQADTNGSTLTLARTCTLTLRQPKLGIGWQATFAHPWLYEHLQEGLRYMKVQSVGTFQRLSFCTDWEPTLVALWIMARRLPLLQPVAAMARWFSCWQTWVLMSIVQITEVSHI